MGVGGARCVFGICSFGTGVAQIVRGNPHDLQDSNAFSPRCKQMCRGTGNHSDLSTINAESICVVAIGAKHSHSVFYMWHF